MLQKDGLVVSKLYENVDKEEKFEASFELEIEDLEAHANLMYECAAEGDLECLNELLDEGKVDVNQVDIDGFTALMIASAEGHRDIVLELLRRGADVSLRTHELRTTALHFAAKNGDTIILNEICKKMNGSIDTSNANGDTPLIWACIEGKAESARVLLSYHANLNAQNQFGATTLICAAMIGEGSEENDSDEDRARIMEMLLKIQPKLVNLQDREGSTAMHLAASCGYLKCVKQLLAYGADITLRNAIGQTPLEEAECMGIKGKCSGCVELLKRVWKNLEEEAAARMMCMLEMEENNPINATPKCSNKKKNRKGKKTRRKSKQSQSNLVVQQSLDESNIKSDKDDEDEDDEDSSLEEHVEVIAQTQVMSASHMLNEVAIENDANNGAVWTTVTRKHKHLDGSEVIVLESKHPLQAENNCDNATQAVNEELKKLSHNKPALDKAPETLRNEHCTDNISSSQAVTSQITTLRTDFFNQPRPTPPGLLPVPSQSRLLPFFTSRSKDRAREQMRLACLSSWRSGSLVSNRDSTQDSKIARAMQTKLRWVSSLNAETLQEALGLLACGICGELVNENLECSFSNCVQLYCSQCVPLSFSCVKCHEVIFVESMRHNAFAQHQAASVGLSITQNKRKVTIQDIEQSLYKAAPLAEEADISVMYLTPGMDSSELSMGQLEILEQIHHQALSEIVEARILWARAQERLKMEEEIKTRNDIFSFLGVDNDGDYTHPSRSSTNISSTTKVHQ